MPRRMMLFDFHLSGIECEECKRSAMERGTHRDIAKFA